MNGQRFREGGDHLPADIGKGEPSVLSQIEPEKQGDAHGIDQDDGCDTKSDH